MLCSRAICWNRKCWEGGETRQLKPRIYYVWLFVRQLTQKDFCTGRLTPGIFLIAFVCWTIHWKAFCNVTLVFNRFFVNSTCRPSFVRLYHSFFRICNCSANTKIRSKSLELLSRLSLELCLARPPSMTNIHLESFTATVIVFLISPSSLMWMCNKLCVWVLEVQGSNSLPCTTKVTNVIMIIKKFQRKASSPTSALTSFEARSSRLGSQDNLILRWKCVKFESGYFKMIFSAPGLKLNELEEENFSNFFLTWRQKRIFAAIEKKSF